MASSRDSAPAAKHARTMIEDALGQRPFMRGIMVHSLMSRGASFDEAYDAASKIREKIRGRPRVSREELAQLVEEAFGGPGRLEERWPVAMPGGIRVEGRHSPSQPFSKGFLSQSLLAAAIEPADAYGVAQEIETELVARHVTSIDRAELRALVSETLAKRYGDRVAARYRVWRAFQQSDKPLILLLGGAAGVGKSSLAQEVARRLGIPSVVSTDSIRQVMRIMLSAELVPAIHASSYDAHQVVTQSELPQDPVLEAFRAQASTVSVGARAMIERAIAEGTDLILEGVSILPGILDRKRFEAHAHVIFLVVASLDEKSFVGRFKTRARGAGQRKPHRYVENLDSILKIQEHVLDLAESEEVPIVENSSFDASVLSILRHVMETLRKRGGLDEQDV